MKKDRIIDPRDVAEILRAYLAGVLLGEEAVVHAMRLARSDDRILAGYRTRPVIAAYWALRRLAESDETKPDREELNLLLECVEGRRRYPREL